MERLGRVDIYRHSRESGNLGVGRVANFIAATTVYMVETSNVNRT